MGHSRRALYIDTASSLFPQASGENLGVPDLGTQPQPSSIFPRPRTDHRSGFVLCRSAPLIMLRLKERSSFLSFQFLEIVMGILRVRSTSPGSKHPSALWPVRFGPQRRVAATQPHPENVAVLLRPCPPSGAPPPLASPSMHEWGGVVKTFAFSVVSVTHDRNTDRKETGVILGGRLTGISRAEDGRCPGRDIRKSRAWPLCCRWRVAPRWRRCSGRRGSARQRSTVRRSRLPAFCFRLCIGGAFSCWQSQV